MHGDTTERSVIGDHSLQKYSLDEVSKHDKEQDCWLYVHDGVYDVTPFVKKHPGGRALLGFAGGDATHAFNMTHKSALSLLVLKQHRIGTLDKYQPTPIAEGIKKMTDEFKKRGYFHYSQRFFWTQVGQIALLTYLGYLVYHSVPGFMGATLAALLVALGQGQAGWFMHDLGHFSCFKSMALNRFVQFLVMNVYLGGSYSYWRNAHWKHHLFTNIEGWDHDLDTLPLFAWTRRMFAKMPLKGKMGRYQEYYWYLLGPGTSFWYIFYLGLNFYLKRKGMLTELAGNAVHFTILYYLVGQSVQAVVWAHIYLLFFLGMYMGHVFSLNHFPMAIKDKSGKQAPNAIEVRGLMEDEFVLHQLRTTRDLNSSPLVDWFTGHLNFQIEHHLWPLMPRHNLHLVQPHLISFCKQHHIPYQCVSFTQAFLDVFHTLQHAHQSSHINNSS